MAWVLCLAILFKLIMRLLYIGSRPSIARVLVALDITKQYPKSIWLGPENFGYVQKEKLFRRRLDRPDL
ncbi:hypothetical protein IEQ34_000690 [Dendrobium chrysotoxum]|uniref:Uncharacterized protein n=1 Tax=Dendrobium chrysotoxum TaxID=161865 RepID=A0AAV7HQA7_DENCH|nr:hypothetical protein IEQ34_000690 [Dendrobium chrysotoxum]